MSVRTLPEVIIHDNISSMIRALGLPGIVRHDTDTDARIVTHWTFR